MNLTGEQSMSPCKPGDKSQAICPECVQIVSTTFERRYVQLDDGSATVPDILAGVCDLCDMVVSIPAQSTPEIKQVIEQTRR